MTTTPPPSEPSHQLFFRWNSDTKSTEWASFDEIEAKETWEVGHYQDYKTASSGTITLKEHDEGALGGAYVECAAFGDRFLSVKSFIDQWGTWYTFKLSNSDESVEFTYPYEWDNGASFLRTFAHALNKLADLSEPSSTCYTDGVVSPQGKEES